MSGNLSNRADLKASMSPLDMPLAAIHASIFTWRAYGHLDTSYKGVHRHTPIGSNEMGDILWEARMQIRV
jgi:hypothetical protein